MRDVVIIADFCGSFDGKSNNRFITIAEMLSDKCSVELITGDFCHENKSRLSFDKAIFPFKITLFSEKTYKENVSAKRLISHFMWGRDVYRYLKERKKPDVIYSAVPTIYASYLASKYCRNNNVPFIIDIQDLWPDAFRVFFDIPILKEALLYPYKAIAEKVYKAADYVFAVSQTYADRAMKVNRKCKNAGIVFLGTNLKSFDMYKLPENFSIQKGENERWIVYCGSLSISYDLSCIIDAIELLNDKRVRLVIIGDGPKRDFFEKRIVSKNITATFTGRLSYKEVSGLLKISDIAVNPIAHNAAQSIINKHADYIAAGLPIISTQENEEICSLITKYRMGYNCKNGNAEEIAARIETLIADETLRKKMGRNARACAEELFDREHTYKSIVRTVMIKAGREI